MKYNLKFIGTTALSLMFSPVGSIYAQRQDSVIVDDNIKIAVINNTKSDIWIEEGKLIYQLRADTTYTSITPRKILVISGKKIEDQMINLDSLDLKKTIWIDVGINRIKKRKIFKSILRSIKIGRAHV